MLSKKLIIPSHDAIFCEDTYNSWLHYQYAGLSKPNFNLLHTLRYLFVALTVTFKDTNLSYQTLNQPLLNFRIKYLNFKPSFLVYHPVIL